MKLLHFTLAVFVLVLFPKNTNTCSSNGICGLQPHCYGSYPGYGSYGNGIGGGSGGGGGGGGGGCGGGCQSNYGCGQYGCYPSRQCGSKTFHPPERIERKKKMQAARLMAIERGELPQKSITETENLEYTSYTASLVKRFPTARLNPNKAFFECCMDRQLPDACLQKCNYGTYSRDALSRMYFKQDECPMAAMAEIQFCAAQGGDHRECCMRNGITTTLAGQKCLTFCDQRPGRVTPLDMSYIPCFDRFESMKSCFYHDLTRLRRS